jgi:chromosome segregation ATPase
VLNELQRHQDKLDSLENEITSLRLANVRLELEIKSNTDTLNKVLAELKQMEKLANEKAADLNLVKWKLGAWATGIAAIFGAIIQGVVKFFLHM